MRYDGSMEDSVVERNEKTHEILAFPEMLFLTTKTFLEIIIGINI